MLDEADKLLAGGFADDLRLLGRLLTTGRGEGPAAAAAASAGGAAAGVGSEGWAALASPPVVLMFSATWPAGGDPRPDLLWRPAWPMAVVRVSADDSVDGDGSGGSSSSVGGGGAFSLVVPASVRQVVEVVHAKGALRVKKLEYALRKVTECSGFDQKTALGKDWRERTMQKPPLCSGCVQDVLMPDAVLLCPPPPPCASNTWQAFRSGAANAMVFVLHKGEAKAIAAHLREALADLADADEAAHDASDDNEDDGDDEEDEDEDDDDDDDDGEDGEAAGAGSGAWVVALQGDMSSSARARALDRFRAGKAKVLARETSACDQLCAQGQARARPLLQPCTRPEHTRDSAHGSTARLLADAPFPLWRRNGTSCSSARDACDCDLLTLTPPRVQGDGLHGRGEPRT